MDFVLGVGLMILGIGSFVAVFVTRLRPNWQGSRIKIGAMSSFGFGLAFFVIGALTARVEFFESRLPDWFGLLALPGVLLVLIGSFTDK